MICANSRRSDGTNDGTDYEDGWLTSLNARFVETTKKVGMHADGMGLYLKVKASGKKYWIYRYQDNKRRRDMSLGPCSIISLADARDLAHEAYRKRRNGIDPLEEKVNERNKDPISITFDTAVDQFLLIKQAGWKSEKHAQQWQNTLKTYCSPLIGRKLLRDINKEDIIKCLKPIWLIKVETANRVRGRIEAILDWAAVNGYRSGGNPAKLKGNLEHLLPVRPKKGPKHHKSMPYKDLPSFWQDLDASSGFGTFALRFLILTACRTSEVLEASWEEFDENLSSWKIPAHRMKAGKEHRVPLTAPASEIIGELGKLKAHNYVFPSQKRDRPLSNMTMAAVLKRMHLNYRPHGFRSSFRTWVAEETDHQFEVAEAALAHTVSDSVVAAYQRGDLFEKRRILMQDWADFVCGN